MSRTIRSLRATPALAGSAALTLALGIGASTTIFSIVNGLLLRPLPVQAPERLAVVSTEFAVARGFTAGAGWNHATYEALAQRAEAFDGVLAWQPARFSIGRGGDSEVVDGIYASDEFFDTTGVRPQRGRVFTKADASSSGPTAVVSHRLWQRRFGGTPDIAGVPLIVNGGTVAVTGVLPSSFRGLEVGREADVVISFSSERALRGAGAPLFQPHSYTLLVMLRLKPGQSLGGATDRLRNMQAEIVPAKAPSFAAAPFQLVPAAAASNPGSAQRVYGQSALIMLAGAGLLFLTACFSVTNLLLTRIHRRRQEIALRSALGAPRWSVVRPLMFEHFLITGVGAALGLLVAQLGAHALLTLAAVSLDTALDWRVMAFVAGVTVLALLLLTLGPAHRATRIHPALVLNEVGRRATSGPNVLSSGLVILQVALGVLLAIPAGLLVQTFAGLARLPLGFDTDRLLIVNVDATKSSAPGAARDLLFTRAADAVRGVPGVERAALSYWSPVAGGGGLSSAPIDVSPEKGDSVSVVTNFISPGWFQTYGIPLRAGRDFGPEDSAGAPRVAIVNEAFVRKFLPETPPVGVNTSRGVIVGVVGDALSRSAQRIPGMVSMAFREPVPPTLYSALPQVPVSERPRSDAIRLSIRAAGRSPASLIPAVGSALTTIDSGVVLQFHTLAADVETALAQERLFATVAGLFAMLALLLAFVGVFGVTADAATRRRPEIGIRMALGATRAGIVGHELRRALLPIVAGLVAGTAGAALATRITSTQLFGIDALDPTTFVTLPAAIGILALTFALIPTMRAVSKNPLGVLQGRE